MAGHAMKESEREFYMLHAQLHSFRAVVDRSRQIIRDALRESCRPYVACSWGKDSTVLLHLVAEQVNPIDVIWVKTDEFDDWPDTERVMRKYMDMLPIRIHIAQAMPITECYRRTGGFYVFADTPEQKRADADYAKSFINAITQKAKEMGFDLAFIGLTEEESRQRRVLLRRKGVRFWAKSYGIWQCFPLARWTGKDIWAYIVSRSLPYLDLYDLSQNRERARNGAMFAANVPDFGGAVHYCGQLAALKKMYPDLFNRFAAEFPEVRCYV